MATTTVTFQHSRATDLKGSLTSQEPKQFLIHFTNLIAGFMGGLFSATAARVSQTAATGTLTLSSASGTVGGSINGVSVTVAFATSDTNTATLLAAAINASTNPLIQGLVSASASLGVVTLTSLVAGTPGNMTTIAASGTGVTASGARLTGGTSVTYTF